MKRRLTPRQPKPPEPHGPWHWRDARNGETVFIVRSDGRWQARNRSWTAIWSPGRDPETDAPDKIRPRHHRTRARGNQPAGTAEVAAVVLDAMRALAAHPPHPGKPLTAREVAFAMAQHELPFASAETLERLADKHRARIRRVLSRDVIAQMDQQLKGRS